MPRTDCPACSSHALRLPLVLCPLPPLLCPAVKMGARLEAVVEGLLEPVPEDRLPAEDAAAILAGKPRPAPRPRAKGGNGSAPGGTLDAYYSSAEGREAMDDLRRPAGSRIVVKKRGPRLEIDIPPSSFR